MWELDHKESWALKNWCFQIVVLEKTLEYPLDCKEIKTVSPEVHQSWISIGRIDAETETPVLWPPDVKNWLIGKDPDAGKVWRQEEKQTTEDEMIGWHLQLDGHEFEQVSSVGYGEGSLASVWSQRVEHNWDTELNWTCVNYSLGIPNFLEEISSLSHSVVFLYFFALIAKEGFVISPCFSLALCIQMGISFLFSFAFSFSSFPSCL